MNELDDAELLAGYLERWLAADPSGPRSLSWIERLPGHAGITYAFGTTSATEDRAQAFVVKLPPAGVTRRGSTDVLRQGGVLRLMHELGIRVPAVRASGTETEGPFPVPFLITDYVPGAPLGDAFADIEAPDTGRSSVEACFAEAVDELVKIHALPWDPRFPRVLGCRTLHDEINHWTASLARAQDPRWVEAGTRVRERLLASAPADTPMGVVHGDFYSNNWLFDGGRLTAIVDWENTVWGPRLVDAGWLCMIYDPASWGPARQPTLSWTPSPESIAHRYAASGGDGLDQLGWFRALAGYRLACLTAHYVRLHRTGRRHDAIWEVFGEAFPFMLDRARALLDGGT